MKAAKALPTISPPIHCFLLNACPLLSAYFLAVSCYKPMRLTTSAYGISAKETKSKIKVHVTTYSCFLGMCYYYSVLHSVMVLKGPLTADLSLLFL